jgi:hypothetical protein
MIKHTRSDALRWLLTLVAVAMVLVVAGCSTGDDNGGEATQAEQSEQSSTGTDADASAQSSTTDQATESAPAGRTQVGLISNIPDLAITWERHTLDPSEPEPQDAFVSSVAQVGDELVVVAFGWSPAVQNQIVYTWRSTDGAVWDGSATEIPQGQHVYQVVSTADDLIALGSRSTIAAYVPRISLWDPDVGWVETDLGTAGVDLEGVEIVGAASTEAGIVLGGRREYFEPISIVVDFELDGHRMEIDDGAGTYQITETQTGRLAAVGRVDEIYHNSDDGQPIYDLDDGTLLTVIPWEVWDVQSADYPLLPIPLPAPADRQGEPGITIEWDGYSITRFEAEDRFEVTLSSTGEVLTSGSLADLYRGPAPRFTDRETGEVFLSVPWEDWYDLIASAHQEVTEPHVTHPAEHVILFSADGINWSEPLREEAPNTHLESVLAADGRFVVTVVEHVESGAVRTVHLSVDGLTWTSERGGVDSPEYLYAADTGSGGAIALTDFNGSSAVALSSDGIVWSTGLFLPPQPDGRYGWLREVASGDLGRAVIGTLDPDWTADVLTVTVGSRTARFAGPDSALRVTDDDSGEVLLDLGWDDLERSAQGTGPTYATYADGITELRSADGTPLMRITNEQAREAVDQRSRRIEAGIDHVLFVEIDGRWYEAGLPDVGGSVPEQIAVGDALLAVGVNGYASVLDDMVPAGGPIEVLIGRPAG